MIRRRKYVIANTRWKPTEWKYIVYKKLPSEDQRTLWYVRMFKYSRSQIDKWFHPGERGKRGWYLRYNCPLVYLHIEKINKQIINLITKMTILRMLMLIPIRVTLTFLIIMMVIVVTMIMIRLTELMTIMSMLPLKTTMTMKKPVIIIMVCWGWSCCGRRRS